MPYLFSGLRPNSPDFGRAERGDVYASGPTVGAAYTPTAPPLDGGGGSSRERGSPGAGARRNICRENAALLDLAAARGNNALGLVEKRGLG